MDVWWMAGGWVMVGASTDSRASSFARTGHARHGHRTRSTGREAEAMHFTHSWPQSLSKDGNAPKAGRQASRQEGRQAGRKAGRQTGRQAGKKASRQAGKKRGKQRGRPAGRQAGRQAGLQAGRQTGS